MFNRLTLHQKYAFGVGLFSVTALIFNPVTTVKPNHVAHTNLFGNISKNKLHSGINIVNPLCSVIEIPLLTNNLSTQMVVFSNEGLGLTVEANTIYKIDENKALDLYLNFRFNYESILIKPIIESVFRDIMSSYETKALYNTETRIRIKTVIEKEIKEKLLQHGIIVDEILINKINLPSTLLFSIENKLKIEQENEQMQFTIQKERQIAEFALEKERLEAERKIIEATGIQKFQEIVSKGISKELIQWKSIEASERLATSSNSKIIIFGNEKTGSLPIIMDSK